MHMLKAFLSLKKETQKLYVNCVDWLIKISKSSFSSFPQSIAQQKFRTFYIAGNDACMEIWKNMEKLWKLTYDLCFNSIAHSPNIPYVFRQHSIISACFLSVFLTSRKEFDWIERFVSILYHSHFCRVQQTSKLGPY